MKAQMKMFETVGVLVVFFFMITVGAIFYFNQISEGHSTDVEESFELRSMDIVQVTNNLPELQCTFDAVPSDNCYDVLKLDAFSPDKQFYYSLLYFSDIKIRIVYPDSGQEWNIYSNIKPDYTKKSVTSIPVSLYNATSRVYYAGILEVGVYQ